MANWVLITEAVEYAKYTPEHIAWLLREEKVIGKKVGGVWMVDLDSLQAYAAKMEELGPKKHDPTQKPH